MSGRTGSEPKCKYSSVTVVSLDEVDDAVGVAHLTVSQDKDLSQVACQQFHQHFTSRFCKQTKL